MSTLQDLERRDAIADYEVLGTPIADLDGLVWLAATLCGVPRAAINIIDDRWQHQVAAVGVEAAICTREDSMCNGVFENREQVVVADARRDERFAANPFVTGEIGLVRFYASSPLITPAGMPIGTLCVFDEEPRELDEVRRAGLALLAHQVVDVLELRRVGRALQRSNEELQSFAGQIGHDLRNPLTAVAGFIELAEGSPEVEAAPEVQAWLARAFGVTRRMHTMISELLEYASSGAEPQREDLDLPAIVDAVREDLTAAIAESGAEVTSEVAVPAVGDPVLVRVLLQNLVANAVKFSRARSARPRIDIRAETTADGVRLTVDDDGPGIPADERTRVFALMSRGRETDAPGLGIGLATCRRIVEAHGGRIGIDDSPLGGARVWVSLPGR